MKRNLFITTLLLFATTLIAQQYYFVIDERYPATKPLLHNAQTVLLVNNTVAQPADFGHTNAEDGEQKATTAISLDNAALHCLFAMTNEMQNSEAYERVELMDISQNKSQEFYTRHLLTNAAAEQLCQDYQVDALIILNQLVLYDIQESFPVDEGQYYAYLQAYAQAHWTIHHAGATQDPSFTTADTLFWESDCFYTRDRVLESLPDRQEALLYLAQQVGINTATCLTPQWQTETHYLYDDKNTNIQQGIQAFQYKHWQEAINTWQEVLPDTENDTENPKTKQNKKEKDIQAMAAANIAVAYEMMADYTNAIAYTNTAITIFRQCNNAYARQQLSNLHFYLQHLNERQSAESVLSNNNNL